MLQLLQHLRVFSEAPLRAFYLEPVWLLAIARSHLGLGLTAHRGVGGGDLCFFYLFS